MSELDRIEYLSVINDKNKKIAELEAALEFYRLEAESIANNFDKNDDAVVASMTVLKLDAGIRAKRALEGK